jgi:hypothetical protein
MDHCPRCYGLANIMAIDYGLMGLTVGILQMLLSCTIIFHTERELRKSNFYSTTFLSVQLLIAFCRILYINIPTTLVYSGYLFAIGYLMCFYFSEDQKKNKIIMVIVCTILIAASFFSLTPSNLVNIYIKYYKLQLCSYK